MQESGIHDASDQRSTLYRCLDVQIEPAIPCVKRAGVEIDLRAKGLQVLLFLFEHRHRVVSRQELLDYAWPGVNVVDATLAGCIQEIRKALGDDAKEPRFIRTVPKLGYRFIAPLDAPDNAIETAAIPSPPPQHSERPFPTLLVCLVTIIAVAAVVSWQFQGKRATAPIDEFAEVAWWKMDEGTGLTVRDSSANKLNGTANGATWEPGKTGGALRLDGVAQRVEGLDANGMIPRGRSPRSLAGWVKVSSTNGDITGILHFGKPAAPNIRDSFRFLLLPDGRPAFAHEGYAGLGKSRSLAISANRVDDGQWHHLVGTFDGSRGVLYVDAVRQAVVDMTPETGEPERQTRWVIGNHLNQIATGFRGSIDDVRIWRRPLRLNEVAALYRCTAGVVDLKTAQGNQYFFSPVFDWEAPEGFTGTRIDQSRIPHSGSDYAGFQLTARKDDCALDSLRGADVGQNLKIGVDLRVPRFADGSSSQAGPYFRSRAAFPGDGIVGGRSAGYWVQLHSSGKVTVKCLNPALTVAFTNPPPGFDATRFHQLDVRAAGERLEVALDGKPLTFDQGGQLSTTINIPPLWERPSKVGNNRGTAGIAFSAEPMRSQTVGQQEARHFVLEKLD